MPIHGLRDLHTSDAQVIELAREAFQFNGLGAVMLMKDVDVAFLDFADRLADHLAITLGIHTAKVARETIECELDEIERLLDRMHEKAVNTLEDTKNEIRAYISQIEGDF